MKKYIFLIFTIVSCWMIACNQKAENATAASSASSITLPYTASYSSQFTNNISDSDLLTVLNSYKAWENGDLTALRATMADSSSANLPDGYFFNGPTDSLIKYFAKFRDSLSAVKINMQVWLKNQNVKDSANWINVWYIEADTYKNGRTDSAQFEDDNLVKNGKIIYYSSHKQIRK